LSCCLFSGYLIEKSESLDILPCLFKCIAKSAHSTCPDDEPHWLVRNASTKISPCDFRRRILQKFEPLFIRVEQSNPKALINTHNLTANDPQLAPRYLATKSKQFHILRICLGCWEMIVYCLLKQIEHTATQLEDQRISLPSKVERGTQYGTYV